MSFIFNNASNQNGWYTSWSIHQWSRTDEVDMKLRKLNEEHMTIRVKTDVMKNNLSRMIREMIDLYCDQKLQPKFAVLVTKMDVKERISVKMDQTIFNNYEKKKQLENSMLNDKEFKTD